MGFPPTTRTPSSNPGAHFPDSDDHLTTHSWRYPKLPTGSTGKATKADRMVQQCLKRHPTISMTSTVAP
eukprot:7213039-Pyramimonas_sp.AAC.1